MNLTPSELPRLGQWASVGKLYRFQDKRLPEALALALHSPFHRGRLDARNPPSIVQDLAEVSPETLRLTSRH